MRIVQAWTSALAALLLAAAITTLPTSEAYARKCSPGCNRCQECSCPCLRWVEGVCVRQGTCRCVITDPLCDKGLKTGRTKERLKALPQTR
jgi:hypothetical protein